ncbi:hypothetical protein [Caldimonas sp. KR1-144]|uniref:hypothetical protein n=1 Tax=Caldimonas sp. KR1-144 TaxID=3400911 RepID=UPI003C00678D
MRRLTLGLSLLACAAAMAQAPAKPGASSPPGEARSRYEQERAACLSGRSSQDREACLREAGAARAEAARLAAGEDPAVYARNARLRCERLPPEDREACLARMDGRGTTSGSVAGGGILRELVTVEIGPRPPAQPASEAASAPAR